MQRTRLAWIVAAFLLWPATSFGQAAAADEFLEDRAGKLAKRRLPNLSSELLDPSALTRFHLTTRMTPSTADETISDVSEWTFEAKAVVRASEHFSVSAALPFGLFVPDRGQNVFFLGNVRLGAAGGGRIRLAPTRNDRSSPRLNLGGAFDVFLPTASAGEPDYCLGIANCDPVGLVRNLRAYEPELFTDDAMFFRLRGQAGIDVSVFSAAFEFGLSPGFTIVRPTESLFLFSWAGRAAVRLGQHIEPYVEIGSTIELVGEADEQTLDPDRQPIVIPGRDLGTPVLATFGLRAHIGQFDPAFFVGLDLRDQRLIFGLDIASALRPSVNRTEEREFLRGLEDDDF